MRKRKKLLSIMTLGIFLVVNTITVSAAEIMSPTLPSTATNLYLYDITSEKAGQEIIAGQMGTSMDHGGTWLQVTLVETETINNRLQIYFNGKRMIMTGFAETDTNRDGIMDERISIWRYEGTEFESGTLAISATATTSPWNSISFTYYIY